MDMAWPVNISPLVSQGRRDEAAIEIARALAEISAPSALTDTSRLLVVEPRFQGSDAIGIVIRGRFRFLLRQGCHFLACCRKVLVDFALDRSGGRHADGFE